jgi:HPr kinase/phosphorylase
MNARPPVVSVAEAFHSKAERLGLVLDAGASGLGRGLETQSALDSHIEFVNYMSLDTPAPVQIIDPEQYHRIEEPDDVLARRVRDMFESGAVCMVVVSDDNRPPEWLVETGNQTGVCVYHSALSHSLLYERLQHRAARKLIQQTTLHGVFLSIRNVGVLITGPSGIGKSEVALDLIDRGSRLIADDVVQVYRSSPYKLTGFCPEIIRGYLEVRGLGILDISDIYGNTAVLDSHPIDLIVNLEPEARGGDGELDRLTPRVRQLTVLATSVPEVTLLVAPGRNLAVLVDAAVRTHIQFQFGKDPIKAFIDKQQKLIERRSRFGVGPGENDDPGEV